jgi:hypothetical protein
MHVLVASRVDGHDGPAGVQLEPFRRLAWPTPDFVPVAEALDGKCDIAELDRLWAPEASEAERALFYSALRVALAEPTTSPRQGTPSQPTLPADTSATTGAT